MACAVDVHLRCPCTSGAFFVGGAALHTLHAQSTFTSAALLTMHVWTYSIHRWWCSTAWLHAQSTFTSAAHVRLAYSSLVVQHCTGSIIAQSTFTSAAHVRLDVSYSSLVVQHWWHAQSTFTSAAPLTMYVWTYSIHRWWCSNAWLHACAVDIH